MKEATKRAGGGGSVRSDVVPASQRRYVFKVEALRKLISDPTKYQRPIATATVRACCSPCRRPLLVFFERENSKSWMCASLVALHSRSSP